MFQDSILTTQKQVPGERLAPLKQPVRMVRYKQAFFFFFFFFFFGGGGEGVGVGGCLHKEIICPTVIPISKRLYCTIPPETRLFTN